MKFLIFKPFIFFKRSIVLLMAKESQSGQSSIQFLCVLGAHFYLWDDILLLIHKY